MNKKKILVCGATGFIGRNVAEYFSDKKNYEVFGTYFKSIPYDNSKINFLKADLTKKEDVDRVVKGKDIVIQMSATTSGAKDIISKPYIHVTDNAITNHLLLRSAFENSVENFIFPSCTVMYPPWNDAPLKETDFTGEVEDKYFGAAWMKVSLEKACEFFSRLGKTKHTVFRHSNIYGPYDKYDLEKSHVFGATITKVMQAPDGSKIKVWGTGEEERDLLYIDDLVKFIETAIEKQQTAYELVNVGLGKSTSVSDLVKKIIDISGKNLEIEYDTTKPTIKTKLALDCSKAKEVFGWESKVSLDEGIQKTIDWYKENIK
ncbi:MAG TPA: NAD-dependent epimerase/dehydratase family protein [Nanoarchaeota archaeon]|nr:NAD-dependent epimerase/dehydratase family protein [Nanoarchaeota archaeon]HIH63866.1 NAD-dependent epimerase/dehydratase family protein [Nanoarchaeota archaeon]HIJ09765.1 NAD-dependent epimerase/dehydratase family protein [Nanoarchaeota archaeon]